MLPSLSPRFREELNDQLKWMILARAVFAIVLIFSTLFFSDQMSGTLGIARPYLSLYTVSITTLGLSALYIYWLNLGRGLLVLAYFQTVADTIFVTAIIFVTGGYESVFTFLYLVVIIYAAMFLLQQGAFVIATMASLQYGLLIELEYFNILSPFAVVAPLSQSVDETQILFRILITIAACFAVATLSGILALQLKSVRQDLKIAQEHLKRVEKMATVDEMISGIAHEIKNPLASLTGSIQMLREETDPGSDADRLMQIILRETGRLKQIVNDIRLISKPSRSNARRISISQAVKDVVTLILNTPLWKDNIQISVKIEEELYVFMDPVHLQQILWNLTKNAAEAIEAEGRIDIRVYAPKGKRIHLIMRDTGNGIDAEKASHIFDPFFTTKPDGSGLGLSIIHRIIDAYDGMIDFESTPGSGTTFTLILQNADKESGLSGIS